MTHQPAVEPRASAGPWTAGRTGAPHDPTALAMDRLLAVARFSSDRGSRSARHLVTHLDDRTGRDVDHALVDRLLDAVLADEVGHAWQRGWQPAELVRQVARSARGTGSPAAGLCSEVVAAEANRYAAATVDPEWEDQLRTLGVEVWWAGDRPHLVQWAERARLPRYAALAHATDLLLSLRLLRALPCLLPPPGTATAAPHRRRQDLDAGLLHRVRALLAKAESTPFPEEAEAFTAKAQELMARHAIDAATLAADRGEDGGVVGRRVPIDDPYFVPKALLLGAVARANRCRSVFTRSLGLATVFGHRVDLATTEVLFASLLVQATAAMTGAGAQPQPGGGARTRAFRRSFLLAYGRRIGERLRGAAEAAVAEAAASTPSLLPVLIARTDAVERALADAYPRVGTTSTRITDLGGWAAGTAAADRAHLGAGPALPS